MGSGEAAAQTHLILLIALLLQAGLRKFRLPQLDAPLFLQMFGKPCGSRCDTCLSSVATAAFQAQTTALGRSAMTAACVPNKGSPQ